MSSELMLTPAQVTGSLAATNSSCCVNFFQHPVRRPTAVLVLFPYQLKSHRWQQGVGQEGKLYSDRQATSTNARFGSARQNLQQSALQCNEKQTCSAEHFRSLFFSVPVYPQLSRMPNPKFNLNGPLARL
jgi:hypothetical protein